MRDDAADLRAHLRRGGLIAYPTESCYGLGCDPRNLRALKRLIRLKGRSTSKGLVLIADCFKRLKSFIRPLSAVEQARVSRSWPGPVTWVVPASAACPPLLTGGRATIACASPPIPALRACAAASAWRWFPPAPTKAAKNLPKPLRNVAEYSARRCA